MKKNRRPYVAPRRIGEPEPGPMQPLAFESWDWTADELADALEHATVHLFCAPGDVPLVQQWVALQPSAHLYRVRANPFVPPRTAYGFQLDGVLAPAGVQCVMRA